ncbi:hypothetical protein ZIOFF_048375 [Zingiber officinale]|uniref:non-specific serine/threonine protein kinase n=1 Tax=Zingiber officinale TaxID=94328 RepID=A0A8J5FZP8_ZINOF|nr:hypothetical protein ZIOFF_048375 [Zingiber officinale]
MSRRGSPAVAVWCFFLVVFSAADEAGAHHVGEEPDADDFTSINCGNTDEAIYTDLATGINYTSDSSYITTGEARSISPSLLAATPKYLQTLRSFPNSTAPPRNCYSLQAVKIQEYLIRVTFMHGDYDGSFAAGGGGLLFDLYVDVNLCRTVNVTEVSRAYVVEVVAVAVAGNISVCLVDKGSGTPFVSAVELRPVPDTVMHSWFNQTQNLILFLRVDLGTATDKVLRYPDDRVDRLWDPYSTWADSLNFRPANLNLIAVTQTVDSDEDFKEPSTVMQTAVAPANSSVLEFSWDFASSGATDNAFYAFLHFAELQNTSRSFNIYLNGDILQANFTPSPLKATYFPNDVPLAQSPRYQWTLSSTGLSNLPPILNALEVYTPLHLTNTPTDDRDAAAIVLIRSDYNVKRNWMGDACIPVQYAWEGLNCTNREESARIVGINLSSSELTGFISSSFASLFAMESLDLSGNKLTGSIPEELGNLPSLRYLNLSGNSLNGDIPAALQQKRKEGRLIFEYVIWSFDSGCFIKTLRSDRGKEYTSKEFHNFCEDEGVERQLTVRYTPQQNGVTERKNQTIVEMAKSMMHEKGLPKIFWAEAVYTAVYLSNRCPTTAIPNKTPFEAWSGRRPSVNHLKVFGSICYSQIPKQKRSKLDESSERCIFVGYSTMSKGYRLFNLQLGQVIISRDVQVDENALWNWEENKVEKKDILISTDKEDEIEPSTPDSSSSQPNEESSTDPTSSNSSSPSATPKSDLGGSLDDMKSTSGYCFSFGSAIFSWVSKKQQSVAQSSAEAEYISASVATSQAIWLRKILADLGHHQIEGTVLHCDNKSAIAMAKNPVHHNRTRHIALKHHFIRQAIEDKEIQLEFEGNPGLCTNVTQCEGSRKTKKLTMPIIVVLCLVSFLLIFVVIFMVWRLRKSEGNFSRLLKGRRDNPLQLENREFTYSELERITDNFKNSIGKGAFGTVYYGLLEDGTQVAVKLRSQSSSQGTKEFLAEALNLIRIHHKNLLALVGYCMDGDHLALVYEYMSQGTLHDHLRDKTGRNTSLSWRQRLQIAVEAAQGLAIMHSLDYLHKGCKPPLVHRDVKTTNILLSETFEAKIADFGLSKAYQNDGDSHVSTNVVGTPGYLDPEYVMDSVFLSLRFMKYYLSYQLSEKSDVYSFGVVLLELITGQPPVIKAPHNTTLIQWVQQRLATGNIEDVVDANLGSQYDVNSIWKAADVALRCTSQTSHQRPSMAEVVLELKESLSLEAGPKAPTLNPDLSGKRLDTGTLGMSQTSAHDDIEYFPGISPAAR